MNQNTYCNPELYIAGKEVEFCNSASVTCSGNSQLESFSAEITEPQFENKNLFNQEVEFYLNYGGSDGTPLFRGFIISFRATETGINIQAKDPRTVITGEKASPVILTERDNYDGSSVVQFLTSFINNDINIDKTHLSTEALKEMDKPVYMTGARNSGAAYTIASTLLETSLDDEDLFNTSYYFFGIYHGPQNSSLTMQKSRNLDGPPDHIFSYNNGIKSIDYTEEAPPTFAFATSEEGDVRFDYGNAPKGKVGIKVGGSYKSKGEAMEAAKSIVLFEQDNIKNIRMSVNKGHYLEIGNIIRLDVPEDNLSGQYRITSKRVSYSRNSINCNFSLGRRPLSLSNAFSRI